MLSAHTFPIALLLLALVGIGQMVSAQMVPQCQCSEVAPCKDAYVEAILPCLDMCQHHAAAIGANYQALRQCVVAEEPKWRATISCTENAYRDSCANGPSSQMVQKRYPETLKIAFMSEINRVLQRSGIADEARTLLATGRRIYGCLQSCMDKRAGSCTTRNNCGLLLPSDSQIVQTGKSCAIQSGVNTPGVQQMCRCAVQAGVQQLANLCSRIQIS